MDIPAEYLMAKLAFTKTPAKNYQHHRDASKNKQEDRRNT